MVGTKPVLASPENTRVLGDTELIALAKRGDRQAFIAAFNRADPVSQHNACCEIAYGGSSIEQELAEFCREHPKYEPVLRP